jgi:EF hand
MTSKPRDLWRTKMGYKECFVENLNSRVSKAAMFFVLAVSVSSVLSFTHVEPLALHRITRFILMKRNMRKFRVKMSQGRPLTRMSRESRRFGAGSNEECDIYGCIDQVAPSISDAHVNGDDRGCTDGRPLNPSTRPLQRQGRRLRRRLRRAIEMFLPLGKVATPMLDDPNLEGGEEHQHNDSVVVLDEVDRLFDIMDQDKDGFLTEAELLTSGIGLTSADLGVMDTNRDGQVSKDELREIMESISERQGIVDEIDDVLGELEPLERQEIRLEGFEPYVLVSVLTAEGSFGMISEMDNIELERTIAMIEEGLPLSQIVASVDWLSIALLLSAGVSTITGIYATTVFSLCILYGKTALGMSRDMEYWRFLNATGVQRYRAFQAFSFALLSFSTSVILLVALRSPSPFRLPLTMVSFLALFFGIKEYESIVSAARPIFISGSETNRQ